MKKSIYILYLLVLLSCTIKEKNTNCDNNLIDIQRQEISFPTSDILQLKSYYLSSSVENDSANILIGYNYKVHALDYINLTTKKLSQTVLHDEGPNMISRLSGIYAQSTDSIWVFDESERISLITQKGNVTKRINCHDYIQDYEEIVINTNHAISTTHLGYNSKHQSLLFTIKDKSTTPISFKVKELFLNETDKIVTFDLSPSIIEPDISKDYANMSEPNVNFNGEIIIYNYPIESHIYTINTLTGKRTTIDASSRYTKNIAEKCSPTTDYSKWQIHGIENPHFFDIMYIPQHQIYARLHLAETAFNANENIDAIAYKRDLYLTLFDKSLQKIHESKLPANRFNPYTGWNAINNGIVLFVDNINDKNDSDNLIVDIISPDK